MRGTFFCFVYYLWMFVWGLSCVLFVEWLSLLFRCIDVLGDGGGVYFLFKLCVVYGIG